MIPKWTQMIPQWSQMIPKWSQMIPKWSQMTLKWYQMTLKWSQLIRSRSCRLLVLFFFQNPSAPPSAHQMITSFFSKSNFLSLLISHTPSFLLQSSHEIIWLQISFLVSQTCVITSSKSVNILFHFFNIWVCVMFCFQFSLHTYIG